VTLTKTDRARVIHAAGRRGDPPSLGPGPRPPPRRGGAATEPTAPNGVKEHRYCLARGCGRPAGRPQLAMLS